MTAEAPKQQKNTEAEDGPTEPLAEPLNREQRRAQARGKKTAKAAKNPIGAKKSNVRSQMPGGGVGKFQLPTKNG